MVINRIYSSPSLFITSLLTLFLFNSIQAQDLPTAIKYTESELFDEAELIFQQLIQEEPNNSKAYFFYGESLILKFLADTISNSKTVIANQAKDLYSKGVEADPADPLNYIGLAKAAFYFGYENEAEKQRVKARSLLLPYKKIKKISNPHDYAFALAKIAESYIMRGNVDTSLALPYLREAFMIDKTNPDIYIIAGDIYILSDDGSTAIRNYNLAQDYDHSSPRANMKIGNIYVRGRQLMAAIPYYEEAIRINPEYAPAYRELGQLYALANRYNQSKEYFQKYLELTKGNIPAMIRYVNALFYAKEYNEVVNTVEEIFAVDNSRSYMNRIAAYSCYEKEDYDLDKALAYMETLFQTVSPEYIIQQDYLYLARILLKKNLEYSKLVREASHVGRDGKEALYEQVEAADTEIDRAFKAYQQAYEYDLNDVRLLSEIATNYYAYMRYEEAARTWEKLIDLGRDDVNHYMQIGRTYYIAHNYVKADSIFTLVSQKFPDHIPSYLMIARTYAKMDPDSEKGLAKPKFEIFLEKAGTDSVNFANEMVEAIGYLGYYHLKKGNYTSADAYYDRLINFDPTNNEFLVKGFSGKASVWFLKSELVGELDEKIPYFDKAIDYHNKVLEIDPDNKSAKSSKMYVTSVKKNIQSHINPFELRGGIRDESGKPIINASIRVKDTAAETLTNTRGEFKFEIPLDSETLLISSSGYKTKEVPITESRIYNLKLERE